MRNGEHSGQLGPLLLNMADFLDEENEVIIKSLTSILEPIVLAVMGVLTIAAMMLAATRHVPLKMLPFDNKNELQVVIDMDEGASLERTEAATAALARYLVRVPEATDVTTYVGTSSPADFNGLIRHYYMRQGANVADIRFCVFYETWGLGFDSVAGCTKFDAAKTERMIRDFDNIADRCFSHPSYLRIGGKPMVVLYLTRTFTGEYEKALRRLRAAMRRRG
jgi:hypothetical protein